MSFHSRNRWDVPPFVDNPSLVDRCSQPAFNRRLVPRFTLPDDEDSPAERPQGRFLARVTDNIGRELFLPEGNPGLGGGGVPTAFVSMPEAAVHEDGQTVSGEHQVRASGEVLALQPEAQAHPVSDSSDGQFGSRVASANPRHQSASPLAVHDVGHAASLNRRDMREAPSADVVCVPISARATVVCTLLAISANRRCLSSGGSGAYIFLIADLETSLKVVPPANRISSARRKRSQQARGVGPKLINFNECAHGGRAPHCQDTTPGFDTFARAKSRHARTGGSGRASAGSEWLAHRARPIACRSA